MKTPDNIFPILFKDVQSCGIFEDSKTFVDAYVLSSPEHINQSYLSEKEKPGFDLKTFVLQHFKPILPGTSDFQSNINNSAINHLKELWPILTRKADSPVEGSSLIPLPYSYIVPGGRFNEIYYWDSYFTMLGLKESGLYDMIENMIDNFAYLINNCGHIPNGNRSYFISRSQPPFFALMVELLHRLKVTVQ